MIVTAITVALVFVIGACILHATYIYGECKGYVRGLDDAEKIFNEVHDEALQRTND